MVAIFNRWELMRLELSLKTSDQVALRFVEARSHLAVQSILARGAEVKIDVMHILGRPLFNPCRARSSPSSANSLRDRQG